MLENENKYQKKLKEKIWRRFPGAMILKLDPGFIQGLPDLLILYNDRWAALEVKRSANASHRPNQDYYVNKFNNMSFSSFIYPENEEEVLNAMERSFKIER